MDELGGYQKATTVTVSFRGQNTRRQNSLVALSLKINGQVEEVKGLTKTKVQRN